MNRKTIVLLACLLPALLPETGTADNGDRLFPRYYAEIRHKTGGPRPRLFFNGAQFAEMKKRLEKEPLLEEMFMELRKRVDLYPDVVNEQTLNQRYGGSTLFYGKDKAGPTAVRAAFVYRLTGEKKYAEKSIRLLRYAADWYNQQYARHQSIGWTSHSRISALAAYDWTYDVMSPADRKAIGQQLMKHVLAAQDTTWIVRSGLQNKGEGTSPWSSSFYGTPFMKFYAGIVFYRAGIDDAAAERLLKEGLKDHLRMLSYRASLAGTDGGGNNSTPGYAIGDAPICERYFYTQWKSLTGRLISQDFPANSLLPHWLFYTTFPGKNGETLEYGTGSGWHRDNFCDLNPVYLAMFRTWFPDSPSVKMVDYLISGQKRFDSDAGIYASGTWRFSGYVPWNPFLFQYTRKADYRHDKKFFDSLPKAYFFKGLGQTYMFSGREKDSTYAMFTCGAKSLAHKQPDENHFVIYKGGFLALDSGTRSASGAKDWLDDEWHDNNYSSASIAHNLITIRMEGEKFKGWPKQKYAVANHGGMYKTIGGKVYAFETNDLFTYVAGDSTACYRPEKCRMMRRQFVFIRPDYFVIHDAAESVKADQTKTWLLHSQNEPKEQGDIFCFDEKDGRLFCRTFLPADFKRTKIGGPGKEFWSDGKNYPLGKTRLKEYGAKVKDFLWGNWRVELTAGTPRTKVEYLNLIQVGMKDQTPKMTASGKVVQNGRTGVVFTAVDGTVWTVLFDAEGKGGSIRAVKNGKTLLERPLTMKIQAQKAFTK